MKYEVKYIQPGSIVFSSVPLVMLCLGILGGLLAFFIVPNPQVEAMTPVGRVMALGMFSVIYMLVLTAVLVLIAFAYNIFTQGLGIRGVRFQLAEADAEEPEEEESSEEEESK